jgi:hypothetical protein
MKQASSPSTTARSCVWGRSIATYTASAAERANVIPAWRTVDWAIRLVSGPLGGPLTGAGQPAGRAEMRAISCAAWAGPSRASR